MLHHMNLRHGPFLSVSSGQKDVELRLHDEKRQTVQAGDSIEFTDTETGETFQALVVRKCVFRDFAELYAHYDKLRMGYRAEETASPEDMQRYYSAAQIARWGVAAIEIKPL